MEKEVIFHGEVTDLSLIDRPEERKVVLRMTNNTADISHEFTYDEMYYIYEAIGDIVLDSE